MKNNNAPTTTVLVKTVVVCQQTTTVLKKTVVVCPNRGRLWDFECFLLDGEVQSH